MVENWAKNMNIVQVNEIQMSLKYVKRHLIPLIEINKRNINKTQNYAEM